MSKRQSESIAKLTEALIAAQAEFEPALKTAENPHRKSKYVDLEHAIKACRPALLAHGLTVMQTTELSEYRMVRTNKQGEVIEAPEPLLITMLAHTSGEWKAGEYPLRPVADDPQGFGAALTYARRYALMALVGLAPEDDDAEPSRRDERRPQRESRANGRQETNEASPTEQLRPWHEVSEQIVQDANEEWARECEEHGIEPPKEWVKILANVHQLNMHFACVAVAKGIIAEPETKGGKWAATAATQLWRKTPRKVMAAVRVYLAEKFAKAREVSGRLEPVAAPARVPAELPEDEGDDSWPEGRQ